MNDMRKLMETVADLDFNSPVEPLPAKGEWAAYYRDSFGEAQDMHQGSFEECVRAAKLAIQSHLDTIEGDVLVKKLNEKDGGVTYHMSAVEEGWWAKLSVEKVRDYSDYNPHLR